MWNLEMTGEFVANLRLLSSSGFVSWCFIVILTATLTTVQFVHNTSLISLKEMNEQENEYKNK